MRRVFHVSAEGLEACEWDKNRLLGTVVFANDAQGREEFTAYLISSTRVIANMLVDIIEEDFRSERIPQVNSREKSVLINRLKDRHYRDVTHVHVQALGKIKGERKEEELLISALTNYDLIKPWLDILNQHNIPLAGIWSTPLLQANLLKILDKKAGNVLLITKDLAHTQRETFFKNGKIKFSRLEKLDSNANYISKQNTASLENLQRGVEQIRHFLTNHRIVGFNDTIQVLCLIPQTDELHNSQDFQRLSTAQLHYQLISTDSVITKCQLEPVGVLTQSAIVTWLCSKSVVTQDYYAGKQEKIPFYRHVFERSLKYASVLGSVGLLAFAALFAIEKQQLDQNRSAAQLQLGVLQNYYDANYGPIESELEKASYIESSVRKYHELKFDTDITPQHYFATLSSVYSRELFQVISLDQMQWSKHSRSQITQIVGTMIGRQYGYDDSDDDNATDVNYSDASGAPAISKQAPIVKLTGKVDRKDMSYRTTVSVMREFVMALQSLPEVRELHLIKTPVDIRPESTFTDQTGLEKSLSAKVEGADSYEILLVLAGESA